MSRNEIDSVDISALRVWATISYLIQERVGFYVSIRTGVTEGGLCGQR